jgi:hypothetical protein
MRLKSFKYTWHNESFFLGLKFCSNVKNKCEKRIFDHNYLFILKVIFFFYNNMMYIKIDLFFIIPLAMTNLT